MAENLYDSAGRYLAKNIENPISIEELINNWIKSKGVRPSPKEAVDIYRITKILKTNNLQKQLIEIYGGKQNEKEN